MINRSAISTNIPGEIVSSGTEAAKDGSKKKWRGIETTQEAINENKAVTIVNRLGQKSISLPRIDDGKRWAGYPGLAGTAKKIAKNNFHLLIKG